MNEQYSGERFYTPAIDERTERDTNVPAAGSDPLTDDVPVEAIPIGETPMGETIVHETATAEAPYTAPVDELVGDAAPVGEPVADAAPVSTSIPYVAPSGVNAGTSAALLGREESEHFRTRWNEIQGKFVDEPRSAVEQADALVSEAVEQITQMFASERSALESQWKQSNDVSTEDLRKALQRYRSFFNRLVV